MASRPYPNGAGFAFTILDDTDVATVANVRPIYELLHSLGMRSTKTVWPLPCSDPESSFRISETLADAHYLEFVRELRDRGFEITWHAATMESSEREDTLRGLETFREHLGHYPRIHVNHAENRENLYWGLDRVDLPALRLLVRWLTGIREGTYLGHVQESPYWWGDAARAHMKYARNLTYTRLNLASINPGMPYVDPRRPLVERWFSASDAEDAAEFKRLVTRRNVDRLEAEGGFCIVATHFGKGFCTGGEVDPEVRAALTYVASRNGWFPTTGELLDWLCAQHGGELSSSEWRRMQVQWLSDLVMRKLISLAGRLKGGP